MNRAYHLTALVVLGWAAVPMAGGQQEGIPEGAAHTWNSVTSLQRQFSRAWEISYNYNGRPPLLPPFFQRRASEFFYANYSSDSYPENFPELLQDRFEALFAGSIRSIDIFYPDGFTGKDLEGALSSFPSLRNLSIRDNCFGRPAAQWEQAAAAISRQKLERLDIEHCEVNRGPWLSSRRLVRVC